MEVMEVYELLRSPEEVAEWLSALQTPEGAQVMQALGESGKVRRGVGSPGRAGQGQIRA
jgi:hypothetical protein